MRLHLTSTTQVPVRRHRKGGGAVFRPTEVANNCKQLDSFIEATIMCLCSLQTKPDLSRQNVVQSWGIRATRIRCATIF